MQFLALFLLCAAFVGGFFILRCYFREREKELYRMEALRASRLYKDLYPLIQQASCRDVEQVRVERERVSISLVQPSGLLGIYDLRQAGHPRMSRIRARVMAEVIAEDIPLLLDRRKYSLRRYRVIRPNGKTDYCYLYTIRIPYKDSIMQARRRIENNRI